MMSGYKYKNLLMNSSMKKMYCIKCNRHRKFKNPEISCIFNKTLVIFIVYSKCGNNDDKKHLKNNNLLDGILLILVLIIINE